MSESWPVRYRPKTFEDVVGQKERGHLRLLMENRPDFPAVLVFRGPSGTGKTTLARIVAMALNCTELSDKLDPCTACDNCVAIQQGTFTGVYEHNAALENGADAMRGIQEKTFLYSAGTHNVFILDEVQSLSSQAWKVLLKTFEEPVPNNVFILVTSEPNKIPRTISTRSLTYNIGAVNAADVHKFVTGVLAREGAEVEGLDFIVDLASGSVRDAIKMAQQCWLSQKSAYELFGSANLSLALIEAMAQGDLDKTHFHLDEMWSASGDAPYVVEQIAERLKEVLDNRYGRELPLSAPTVARLDRIAKVTGEKRLAAAFETLASWYPRTRQRAHLLFLVADLFKALHHEESPKVANAAKPARPTTPIPAAQASEQLKNILL